MTSPVTFTGPSPTQYAALPVCLNVVAQYGIFTQAFGLEDRPVIDLDAGELYFDMRHVLQRDGRPSIHADYMGWSLQFVGHVVRIGRGITFMQLVYAWDRGVF